MTSLNSFLMKLTLAAMFLAVEVSSQIPREIFYQGVLSDFSGTPRDGRHRFVFYLYDDQGVQLYSYTPPESLLVTRGLFYTTLNFPAARFDQQYLLGIEVNGTLLSDPVRLASTAYSIASIRADTAGYAAIADSARSAPQGGGLGSVTSIGSGSPGPQAGTSGLWFSSNPITEMGTIAIANNGVDSAKIAPGAVTSTRILDGTIGVTDIGTNAVGSDELGTGSVALDSTDVIGTLGVANGGTGATTGAVARGNLGAATSGTNSDITSLAGLTTPLSISQGGTGASTFTTGSVLFVSSAGNSFAEANSRFYWRDDLGSLNLASQRGPLGGRIQLVNPNQSASTPDTAWTFLNSGGDLQIGLTISPIGPTLPGLSIDDITGYVGIGRNDPQAKLDVFGTIKAILSTDTSGGLLVFYNPITHELSYQGSSRVLKTNIRPLEVNPSNVLSLQAVRFDWKKGGMPDIGLIAEDVDEVIKDLAVHDSENYPISVKYEKLSIYLLEVIKLQEKRITQLEKSMRTLLPDHEAEQLDLGEAR